MPDWGIWNMMRLDVSPIWDDVTWPHMVGQWYGLLLGPLILNSNLWDNIGIYTWFTYNILMCGISQTCLDMYIYTYIYISEGIYLVKWMVVLGPPFVENIFFFGCETR